MQNPRPRRYWLTYRLYMRDALAGFVCVGGIAAYWTANQWSPVLIAWWKALVG